MMLFLYNFASIFLKIIISFFILLFFIFAVFLSFLNYLFSIFQSLFNSWMFLSILFIACFNVLKKGQMSFYFMILVMFLFCTFWGKRIFLVFLFKACYDKKTAQKNKTPLKKRLSLFFPRLPRTPTHSHFFCR